MKMKAAETLTRTPKVFCLTFGVRVSVARFGLCCFEPAHIYDNLKGKKVTWDDSFLLFGFAHVGRTCNYNYSYAFVLLYVHPKTNHII